MSWSILIDEAPYALIISGQAEDSSELYRKINFDYSRTRKHEDKEMSVRSEGDGITLSTMKKVNRSIWPKHGQDSIWTDFTTGSVLPWMVKSFVLPQLIFPFYNQCDAALASSQDVSIVTLITLYKENEYCFIGLNEHTGRTWNGRRWSKVCIKQLNA